MADDQKPAVQKVSLTETADKFRKKARNDGGIEKNQIFVAPPVLSAGKTKYLVFLPKTVDPVDFLEGKMGFTTEQTEQVQAADADRVALSFATIDRLVPNGSDMVEALLGSEIRKLTNHDATMIERYTDDGKGEFLVPASRDNSRLFSTIPASEIIRVPSDKQILYIPMEVMHKVVGSWKNVGGDLPPPPR
ncbi:MAG: hypothetical protein SFX19_03920 [Alphaproteobacteria bacterium]|nr:hypothetical protein [Alphaproteobacteria bacterium]